MLLILLLLVPIIGVFAMSVTTIVYEKKSTLNLKYSKIIALTTSIINLFISLTVFIIFNFSSNQFQFVQEYHNISNFDFYLGVDGLSVYFVVLTAIIIPVSLLSNWSSISENVIPYLIIILVLETLLLAIFTVLDMFLFYIFFESILPPLFLLIGIFGSSNRVRAGFYLFLYTLLGSLFMLLSILHMSYRTGNTDFDAIYKTNFDLYLQVILFVGIFIAFAVKTPTIFLNTWLLKAHVESPLGGSIILAGIVLKLSLYGIFRLILALLPQANVCSTYVVYTIGVITILYASLSTLRTIDVKELIAYSSVSHAAVYLLGVFSNTIQGITGGIILGLAHGFVSSGLFICAGGALYDRSSTRLITIYRGMTQIMPLFSILFFILCLGNAGTPLSLNFIGEFMSLYGTFERLTMAGVFASSSIVFSAAYTMYMFNRISFGGSFTKFFMFNVPDLSKREFYILLSLVVLTVILGVYPSAIIDGLNYSVSSLLYDTPADNAVNSNIIYLLLPFSISGYLRVKFLLLKTKLTEKNFWVAIGLAVTVAILLRAALGILLGVSPLDICFVALLYFFTIAGFRFMLNKVLDAYSFHKSSIYDTKFSTAGILIAEVSGGSFWYTAIVGAIIGLASRFVILDILNGNLLMDLIPLISLVFSTDVIRDLAYLIIGLFRGEMIPMGHVSGTCIPENIPSYSTGISHAMNGSNSGQQSSSAPTGTQSGSFYGTDTSSSTAPTANADASSATSDNSSTVSGLPPLPYTTPNLEELRRRIAAIQYTRTFDPSASDGSARPSPNVGSLSSSNTVAEPPVGTNTTPQASPSTTTSPEPSNIPPLPNLDHLRNRTGPYGGPSQLLPSAVSGAATADIPKLINDSLEGRLPINPPRVYTTLDARDNYREHWYRQHPNWDPVYRWDTNKGYDSKTSTYSNNKPS